MKNIQFEWDAGKASTNQKKHGISFCAISRYIMKKEYDFSKAKKILTFET